MVAMWHKVKNRRKFFEEYAKDHGFDHNNPKKWYLQSRRKIEAKKVQAAQKPTDYATCKSFVTRGFPRYFYLHEKNEVLQIV